MPSWAPLTDEEIQARRRVGIGAETVTNTTANDLPHHYGPEQDESWDIKRFRRNLKVEFRQNQRYDSVFSLVGVDASIANAFRRILLAEIPTLAIEDVFVYKNTSIVQDEVLAQRLGLIPLTGSEQALRELKWYYKTPPPDDFAALAVFEAEQHSQEEITPSVINTVVLTLDVECRWAERDQDGRDGKDLALHQGVTDPEQRYVNSNVYARDLKFKPVGSQGEAFVDGVRSTNSDILIAKLRPGQHILVHLHCIKGIGADHAKFSPVATASYRLLPDIKITSPITGADAKKFARCFPKGVIEVVDDKATGERTAVVKDPYKDTVSRECLRHDEFKDKVKLGRIRDHFIFSIESLGQFGSDTLFLDSVAVLKQKAEKFLHHLDELEEGR